MGVIESFLRKKIGLDPRFLSPKLLRRVIKQRMEACRLEREEDYFPLIFLDEEEQNELIEAVLVPETWFFRDREPYLYLYRYVQEHRSRKKGTKLQVLSVPASTGEEPYSVAIAMMASGLTPEELSIDAVEISRKAIEKARLAHYGLSSFRERDFDLWHTYFVESDQGYLLKDEVRHSVNFFVGNVLNLPEIKGIRGDYDIIFFRNLLIYLDEDARKKAVAHIDGLLKADGLLFLGYAEPQEVFFPGYIQVGHARSYASRKKGFPTSPASGGRHPVECDIPLPVHPSKSLTKNPTCLLELPSGRINSGYQQKRGSSQKASKRHQADAGRISENLSSPHISYTAPRPGDSSGCRNESGAAWSGVEPATGGHVIDEAMELAQGLAGSGDLSGAATICHECLRLDPAFVPAHYLLSVIALSQGDEEMAREGFNRVVYLDSRHVEALIHLSLMMEREGQMEMAERYRKRAERAKRKIASSEQQGSST